MKEITSEQKEAELQRIEASKRGIGDNIIAMAHGVCAL